MEIFLGSIMHICFNVYILFRNCNICLWSWYYLLLNILFQKWNKFKKRDLENCMLVWSYIQRIVSTENEQLLQFFITELILFYIYTYSRAVASLCTKNDYEWIRTKSSTSHGRVGKYFYSQRNIWTFLTNLFFIFNWMTFTVCGIL